MRSPIRPKTKPPIGRIKSPPRKALNEAKQPRRRILRLGKNCRPIAGEKQNNHKRQSRTIRAYCRILPAATAQQAVPTAYAAAGPEDTDNAEIGFGHVDLARCDGREPESRVNAAGGAKAADAAANRSIISGLRRKIQGRQPAPPILDTPGPSARECSAAVAGRMVRNAADGDRRLIETGRFLAALAGQALHGRQSCMVASADAKKHAARVVRRLAKGYPDAGKVQRCTLRTPLQLLIVATHLFRPSVPTAG